MLPKEDESTRAKNAEDKLLRLHAEFENYKKRAAKDSQMVREFATADLLMKMLTLVDDFDAALVHAEKHSGNSETKELRHGMNLIFAKLIDFLKREGVEELPCKGERFDPYKHDALRQGDGEEGKIVEVIQKGYSFNGKILRHAKVVVGKGKQA